MTGRREGQRARRKNGVEHTKAARAGDDPNTIPAHTEAKRFAFPITLSSKFLSIALFKLSSRLTRSASSVTYAPAKPDKPMARDAPRPADIMKAGSGLPGAT